MDILILDKKKFVIIPLKEYEELVTKAAQKASPVRKLSLAKGKKGAFKLIDTLR